MSNRAIAFVDGFNLYHSIGQQNFRKYRWLDLNRLVSLFLRSNEQLEMVKYYTALATWRSQGSISRHITYISALESTGVQIIRGSFIAKDRVCPLCKKHFQTHEEKLTDVNIAVDILSACIQKKVESIYLVSGDNDLIPALKAVKSHYPNIELTVLLPLNAKAKHLMKECRQNGFRYARINQQKLALAQLADPISTPHGTLHRLGLWK